MDQLNRIEALCKTQSLYPKDFYEKFGMKDSFWFRSNWYQREECLRHDMVCALLCNLETMNPFDEEGDLYQLAPKLRKVTVASYSGGTTSSSSNYDAMEVEKDEFEDAQGDAIIADESLPYRYVMLEGRTADTMVHNTLSSHYSLPRMSKKYDIFDKVERKFIEVKVTVDFQGSIRRYGDFADENCYTALIMINPQTFEHDEIGKRDEMPGLHKALDWLLKRREMWDVYVGAMESELAQSKTLIKSFNNCSRDLRKLEIQEDDLDPEGGNKIQKAHEHLLKKYIEDTSKRDAPFMQYKGKILPDDWTSKICTKEETDSDMVSTFFKKMGKAVQGDKCENYNWLKDR